MTVYKRHPFNPFHHHSTSPTYSHVSLYSQKMTSPLISFCKSRPSDANVHFPALTPPCHRAVSLHVLTSFLFILHDRHNFSSRLIHLFIFWSSLSPTSLGTFLHQLFPLLSVSSTTLSFSMLKLSPIKKRNKTLLALSLTAAYPICFLPLSRKLFKRVV